MYLVCALWCVVIVRDSRLDGHTEEVGLRVPVKEPTSCGHPRARKRYIGVFTLCAATFIGDFFPPDPLLLMNRSS
jgi:hypothetical protein